MMKNIKKIILLKSFKNDNFFKVALLHINKNINNIISKNKTKFNNWIDCKDICYHNIFHLCKKEINSTAYILKCISESIINSKQKIIIDVSGNLQDLTGEWINDKIFFSINIEENNNICNNDRNNCDLIFGFGPSASGKTYNAKKIISILKNNNKIYSDEFISIDGGNYRSSSVIYKIINFSIRNKQYAGINNLISPNIFSKKLFDSNIVKNFIIDFLKTIHKINNVYFNLYIPDTLSKCIKYINCNSIYKKYINISNNKWIGLLIWQHITNNKCIFKDKYKCKGCIESGKERELEEGKKYSSSSYYISMINGRHEFFKASKLKYEIHNSGNKNKSLLIDYNDDKLTKFEDFEYVYNL